MFQQFATLQEYRTHQALQMMRRRHAEDRRKAMQAGLKELFERRSGEDRRD